MTLREFFQALSESKAAYEWKIYYVDMDFVKPIRGIYRKNSSIVCCPITTVCFSKKGQYFSPYDFYNAALLLNLPYSNTIDIVRATDGTSGHNKSIRQRLFNILQPTVYP